MPDTSSIDQNELEKFNKTDKEWWDEDGEFKMLHKINPIRIEYIESLATKHFGRKTLENLKIIDIGCGGGLVCVPLAKKGAKITGIDANTHNIEASNSYAERNDLNIKYINKPVEEHLKSKEKYDIVLCLEVIEHVANPAEFLLNLSKILAPNGLLILSTINRTPKSYGLAIIMAEYVLGWVKKGTHDYSNFVKPSEFVNMLKDTHLKLSELKGLTISLPSKEWHISDDIDVNYFAVFKQ